MQLPNLRNIDKFTLAIVGSLTAVGVIVIYLGFVLLKDKIFLPKISFGPRVSQRAVSDILFLTSPVYSINGKIDQVSGDQLWVTQEAILSSSTILTQLSGAAPKAAPTPIIKNLTFRVKVPESVIITKIPAVIPYLFRETAGGAGPAAPGAASLSFSELVAGSNVAISTTTDLRVTNSNDVVAGNITLYPGVNFISGQITAINNNTLTVRALVPTSAAFVAPAFGGPTPVEKELSVVIDSDTEISQSALPTDPTQSPSNKQLSLSDLNVGNQIIIYTDIDISSTSQFTAKLILPSFAPIAAAPVPPAPATP